MALMAEHDSSEERNHKRNEVGECFLAHVVETTQQAQHC
jgi:hypothetical protein